MIYEQRTMNLPILSTLCLSVLVAMSKKMQNEPNFSKRPVLRSLLLAKKEPNLCKTNPICGKTNNKQFSNEPNFKNAKMNLTSVKKRYYENIRPFGRRKNEPNFKRCNNGRIVLQAYIEILKALYLTEFGLIMPPICKTMYRRT